MTQGERPFADTLILPLRDELREDSRYDHWLKLADVALAAAREEQARIKEQIRPHVERYKQLRGASPAASVGSIDRPGPVAPTLSARARRTRPRQTTRRSA